jgi:hypothetical protein
MSKKLVMLAALVTTFLLIPADALADKPRLSCPPGFDLGALTFEQAVALPGTQRGLADGVYTLADLQAIFDSVDKNNNDLICFQDVFTIAGENPNPASGWQSLFNIVDDNASNP